MGDPAPANIANGNASGPQLVRKGQKTLSPFRMVLIFNIIALISLNANLVLIILKVGESKCLVNASWAFCVPFIIISVGAFGVGRYIKFSSLQKEQQALILSSTSISTVPAATFASSASSFLLNCDLEELDSYHETTVFLNVLLCISYAIFGAFALVLSFEPCTDCLTPYQIFTGFIAASYTIRLIHTCIHLKKEWARMRVLCAELKRYQFYYDEFRLMGRVLPDLNFSTRIAAIDYFLWVVSVVVCLTVTFWISNKACLKTCTTLFYLSKYLLEGVITVEVGFMITESTSFYLYRVSGMENLMSLVTKLGSEKAKALKEQSG